MGEICNEMNFDVASTYVPKTIAQILTEVSMVDDFEKKASMLEFHVYELEKEIKKIEYFTHELPRCMYFLEDAVGILKEEMVRCKGREKEPVTVEYLGLKSNSEGWCGGVNRSFDVNEKKKWMCSANLWSTPAQYEDNFDIRKQDSVFQQKTSYKGEEVNPVGNLLDGCSLKNRGGAFLPFKKPEKIDREEIDSVESSIDLNVIKRDQQLDKKHRRCWSPELHKRFVDALHRLGGEQAATPKQIKELMKVDGLTNDQVKSHLQKYRLHIRKLQLQLSSH